ncbi:MAG: N-acetylmuramoyl-L-alanine amidase [Eubacteriales bacterium]|nr:N-acetylmuramoyl-L-alanine amidase [Eubacteriales bacterium]
MWMAALLLVFVYLISRRAGMMVSGQNVTVGREKPVVVIDSGHGGNDPGKIGVDGSLEKDINLQIAKRLKAYLESSDVKVVMTREDDRGLYQESDSHKKMADMRNRCALINEAEPDLVVSIHQNSYHQEGISGGQVFYYKGSEQGKRLAEILQKRFDFVLGERNRRLAKPNGNYYLLLHVKKPIVIVECGFLSNWKEAAALKTEDYQNRLAWTIHMGVMKYLNSR